MKAIGRQFGVGEIAIAKLCGLNGIPKRPPGYPGTEHQQCSDGTVVKSQYERRVAEWLITNHIPYEYEPRVSFDRRMRSDFLVRGVYIEVWGIEGSARYTAKRRYKVAMYEAHGLALLELVPADFRGKRAIKKLSDRFMVVDLFAAEPLVDSVRMPSSLTSSGVPVEDNLGSLMDE